jgi:hypothetical protein
VLTDPNGVSTTLDPVDEVQFVQDLNLGVEGQLSAAASQGATSATVTIPFGRGKLQPFAASTVADPLVMIMLDSQANQVDMLQVKTLAASGDDWSITFDSAGAGQDQYGTQTSGGFFSGVFNNAHTVGAPCTFIAPLQVVRFTVVPRALDPSDPNKVVPCLVRQTAPLVPGSIFHPDKATSAPSQSTNWTEQIMAEGVSGFKVDLSLDGGQTFLRYAADGTLNSGMATWANVYTALDSAIKALATSRSTSPLKNNWSQGLTSSVDPVWTNYLPVTFRLDIETRTRLARAEYSANQTTPTPAYRTRTVTMMISPKNFALGGLQ